MSEPSQNSSTLPDVAGAVGSKPAIKAPTGMPPSSLEVKNIFIGTGDEAKTNSTLEVHYTLVAWSSAQLVESS
jgi:peptidylprolyl isomerase